MTKFGKLAHIFGVEEDFIVALDRAMAKATSRRGVAEYLVDSIEETITRTLGKLGINSDCGADEVREVLREAIFTHEHQFLDFLNGVQGATEFEKAMNLARKIAKVGNGFFLKKDRAQKILEERPPMNLIKFFGYSNVQELLKKQDITESFSALRFIESNEWMHETFDKVYSNFTVHDFEERPIELRVLGSEWLEVSKKFVAKKHHNVSHLKEFGVIFLNPIREDMPGKFLRDFALLLHYFHEIEFYAKLFRRYSQDEDFAVKFKSFLRGDVQERNVVSEGEWLIVQRYLWKENPDDLRLKLPRVNPESMHWARG
ncbi:hypothetical protein HY967_02290, partial [Candidatus Jorgensenbacteria bacterium]|nr:hypothetical protein [Candidatus Jorgensenbacteria bacterium]